MAQAMSRVKEAEAKAAAGVSGKEQVSALEEALAAKATEVQALRAEAEQARAGMAQAMSRVKEAEAKAAAGVSGKEQVSALEEALAAKAAEVQALRAEAEQARAGMAQAMSRVKEAEAKAAAGVSGKDQVSALEEALNAKAAEVQAARREAEVAHTELLQLRALLSSAPHLGAEPAELREQHAQLETRAAATAVQDGADTVDKAEAVERQGMELGKGGKEAAGVASMFKFKFGGKEQAERQAMEAALQAERDEGEAARAAFEAERAAMAERMRRLEDELAGARHALQQEQPTAHELQQLVGQLSAAREEREATREKLDLLEIEMLNMRAREAGLKADLLALQDSRDMASAAPLRLSSGSAGGGPAEQKQKRGLPSFKALGNMGKSIADMKDKAEAKIKEAQQKR
jgi:chromosome segregation ATPase